MCGGVSDHLKACETNGCALEGHELTPCDCTDGQHYGRVKKEPQPTT